MVELKRQSPVRFNVSPRKVKIKGNWTVAMEYEKEGSGPWLADLSHKTRWDLQDSRIEKQTPGDMAVPAAAGESTFTANTLINRMNRTQASIYHLGDMVSSLPDVAGYTDATESTIFLALFGPNAFSVAEKLSNLDLMDPAKDAPFLVQGPFCHVPCQIVTLSKDSDSSDGFLLTCSRGYGESMVQAILKAGAEFGLRLAGEQRFDTWIQGLQE